MSNPIVQVGVSVEQGSLAQFHKLLDSVEDMAVHVDIGIHDISGQDVVTYAGANEFGAENAGASRAVKIPERSFIRSTIDDQRDKYVGRVEQRWNQILEGTLTPHTALSLIGLEVQRDIQRKIRSDVPPPNALSTIKKKGSAHTLIDDGTMVQEVRYAVKNVQEQTLEMSQPTDAGVNLRNKQVARKAKRAFARDVKRIKRQFKK